MDFTKPAEWIVFLVETLGFKREKVDILVEKHYVNSVEEFLNAYAPDKENGLH